MVVDIDFRSKSPKKIILDVLSQALSRGDMMRSKNFLSFGGLYITENSGTDLQPESLKPVNKQVFTMHSA